MSLRFHSAVLATTISLMNSGLAIAQNGLPYHVPQPNDSVGFGTAIATGGDLNGDGHDEFMVMDWAWRNSQSRSVGKFYCYSGIDGSLLWSDVGIGSGATEHYAVFVSGAGPNGTDGVVVSLGNYRLRDDSTPGELRMYTGANGDLMWTVQGEQDVFEIGPHMAALEDVTNDGVDDFVGSTPSYEADGKIRVFDGMTGAVLREIAGIDYPERLASAGDLTGDGLPEILVSSINAIHGAGLNEVHIINPVNGKTIGSILSPNGDSWFGQWIDGGVDMTGDDVPDILVCDHHSLGNVYLFSGRDGAIVSEYPNTTLSASGYGSWCGLADVAGDDLPEVLVASHGYTFVFDARTEVQLGYWWTGPGYSTFFWGTEHAVGDINHDGKDDVLGNTLILGSKGVQVYGGAPLTLSFDPDARFMTTRPRLHDGRVEPNYFSISGADKNGRIHLLGSLKGNECTFIPKLDICIDLSGPVYQIGSYDADENGRVALELTTPENIPSGLVWLQALEANHKSSGAVKSNVLMLETGN